MRYIVQRFPGLQRQLGTLALRASRLAALEPEARRFAARAWLTLPAVELSLAVLGLRRTLRWIEAVPPGRRRLGRTTVEQGGRLVRGAYRRHPLGGQCLSQAAVQYLLHRRDGVPAKFVVGVRHKDDRDLDAHAWVESAGGPAADGDGFEPILERGGAGA